jgi:micrococcal nuclease
MFGRVIFFVLFIAFAQPSLADSLTGKVIGITDGDTLTVLKDNKQYKIRLAEIDTPEKDQPYGNKAKQALSDFVFGKSVRIEVETTDRYGRTVGKVYLGDMDVNAELVRNGHAWVYRRYAKDKTLYDLETEARENQLGLWALPEAQRIPPWEWRRGKRN